MKLLIVYSNGILNKLALPFLLLFLIFSNGNAEFLQQDIPKHPRQYSIMEWTIDDGLPSNSIFDIIQTKDGFLWIATEGGLSRFDGVSFTNITRQSHPILLSNRISSLLEDSDGNVWFGTRGGGAYTITRDTLLRITDDMGLPSNYVLSIAEDSTGNIWFGTDGEGLGKVLPDTVITYSEEHGVNRHINSITVDQYNTLWLGTNHGITLYKDNAFTPFEFNQQFPALNVYDIFIEENEMWIATISGIIRYSGGEIEKIDLDDPEYIISVTNDRKGNTWAATMQNGIYKITTENIFNYIHDDPQSVLDANIVYSDIDGNIWVGTQRSGLIRLRDEIVSFYTMDDGLSDNFIFSVTEATPGEMWFGSTNGLTRLKENRFTTYNLGTSTFDNYAFSVVEDVQGNIYAGTRSGQIFYRSPRGTFKNFYMDVHPQTIVWSFYSDRQGAIWMGTNNGLYKIDNGELTRFSTGVYELTNNDVRSIVEDKNGALWIGTSYGLNKYVDNTFTHFTDEAGFSDLVIASLYADGDGDIWAGSFGGLYRMRDGIPKVFTQEHGLDDDRIGTILEDDYGFLWLGTPSGILRIEKSELNNFLDGNSTSVAIQRFGKGDGLKNESVQIAFQPIGWKAHDGTLWFATEGGVANINPAEVAINIVPPPVYITSTRIDRSDVTPFRTVKPLSLSRNHNEIEIAYTAPTFIKPSEVYFRYKLEGLHSDWIEAGSRRSAYFTRIPPGEYTFRVIAANEDGIWNEAGASLPVVVYPPFWMTWWFLSFVVVMFLSTGPFIYYRRITNLKKEQQQQQKFTRRLIESQEAERNRIAAELHDSLGQNLIVIKNRAMMGKQVGMTPENINSQLEEISITASETISEIRNISHNLRPVNLERFGLTQSIESAIRNANEASDIIFHQQLENIDGLVNPENEIHIFRIIQETMNNILKHSKANSVQLDIQKKSGFIIVSIRDDGIGFNPKEVQNLNGFGLEDIEQRAGLINGKLNIKSMPGNGTSIQLTIPFRDNPYA